jgi:hypothetical protein
LNGAVNLTVNGQPACGTLSSIISCGKGGTGSINNNYSTVQANVGDGNVYGNVKGATVGAPTVASTSGKASSTNKNANVLSTGGPAAHVRAPNAARTSRPTNNKANPRTKNP